MRRRAGDIGLDTFAQELGCPSLGIEENDSQLVTLNAKQQITGAKSASDRFGEDLVF